MTELQVCARCDETKIRKNGTWGRWTEFALKGKVPDMEPCDQCGGGGKETWTKEERTMLAECTRCRGEGKIIKGSFLCCCCDAEINHNGACNLHTQELIEKGEFSDWKDVKEELGIEPKLDEDPSV